MSLASIWNGRYRPLLAMPLPCRTTLGVFGFPILFLLDRAAKSPYPRAYADDDLLAADLTLGEVLAEELNLVVPEGSMIVACNPLDESDPYLGVQLAGEVLYKIIATHHGKEPGELFYWAFQSLALTWFGTDHNAHAVLDRIFADIMGLPKPCSVLAAKEYLTFLEPDFGTKSAWAGLGNLLAEQQTATAGYRILARSFAAVDASVDTRI